MILKLVICSSQIIYHTNSLKWHLTTGGIRQIGKITVLGYTQPCLSSNTQNRLIVTEKSKHCQDWNFSPLNSLISLSGSRHHTHPGKCLAVETLDEKSNMNLEDCDQNSLLQQFSIDDTDGSLRPVHGDDEWCVMTTGKNGKQKLRYGPCIKYKVVFQKCQIQGVEPTAPFSTIKILGSKSVILSHLWILKCVKIGLRSVWPFS